MSALARTIPLRHLVRCLDGKRVPLNREERGIRQGAIPYWGAGGVVDHVDRHLFHEELVLLGEDGAPFFEAGRDVAFLVSEPVWVNNHIHVLRPVAVEPRFLKYSLNATDFGRYITGSTRDKLTQEDMRQIQIWCPPRADQRKIADFLDAEFQPLDLLVASRGQQEPLLAAAEGSGVEARLQVLLGGAPRTPLKYLVKERDDRLGDREAPTLLSVSIHHGVVPRHLLTDKEPRADDLAIYKCCSPGDLILNRMRAFQGGIGIAQVSGIVSPDYTVMRATPGVLPEFLHYLMRAPWFVGEMTRLVRGVGGVEQGNVRTPRVNFGDLGLIRIPIPSLPVQHNFVHDMQAASEHLRAVRALVGRQAERLTERRVALMTAAVTGQLDVATARGAA